MNSVYSGWYIRRYYIDKCVLFNICLTRLSTCLAAVYYLIACLGRAHCDVMYDL